jgi:hypothetical protein
MRLCLALIGAVLMGCQSAHAPAAGMASLRVKVVAEPKEGVKMASNPLRVYDTQGSSQPKETGDFEKVDYANLGDIVVWLEPDRAPVANVWSGVVSVRDQAAAPDALRGASVGAKLTFRNAGTKTVNVYSVSDGNEFDLGKLAPGASGDYVVKSAGLIEVLTDSVKEPIALVYATPTRWSHFARSGQTVTFEDLPPGEYRVKTWHPRLPGGETAVKLTAGEIGSATVKVGVNSLPKVAAPR